MYQIRFCDSIVPRYPRKQKTPTFWNKIRVKSAGFDLNDTWWRQRTHGDRRWKFRCPIRHPSSDITKTLFNTISQATTKKMTFLQWHTQFWQIWTGGFTGHLNRTFKGLHDRPHHCISFFFCSSFGIVNVFSGGWIGHMPRKKKLEWQGRSSLVNVSMRAWTTPRKKMKKVQIPKRDGGMDNQMLKPLYDWPSSYIRVLDE